MTIEEIEEKVVEIRVLKEGGEYEIDLEKTKKKIEKVFKCKINQKKIEKKDLSLKDILFYSRYSGSVRKIDEENFEIKISPLDIPKRRELTLAHEFGHIALKHIFPETSIINEGKDSITIEEGEFELRKSIINPSDSREIDADEFAYELLMPKKLIEKIIPKKEILNSKIIEVAEKFGVQESTMRERLDSFNYLIYLSDNDC